MSDLQKTDILSEIIRTKRQELAAVMAPKRSLRKALAASKTGIIAEFKRKSPSKGWIHPDAVPEEVVPAYAAAGAAALSILTDETYFGGSLDFIRRVRPLTGLPILRKDFIIDPVQLAEARLAGADAVLLIAACLSRPACATLTAEAHRLGLEVLLEVHGAEELDYITPDIDVVGVNNRHLGSFVTNVQTSFDLAPLLAPLRASSETALPQVPSDTAPLRAQRADRNYFPVPEKPIPAPPSTTPAHTAEPNSGPVLISESGISDPATVRALRDAGYRGFLMGEHFMRQPDPGAALAEFLQAL